MPRMNPESFAYWLQGFFELAETDKLTEKQVQIIKDHLALVFQKVTPKRDKAKKAEIVVGDIESSSGSTTAPTAEELMELVKESAKKQKARPQNQTYRWTGGNPFGRKYC